MEKTGGRGPTCRGRAHESASIQGADQLEIQAPMGRGEGRVFMLNPPQAQTINNMMIGIFIIEYLRARVLFDFGATHSFISFTHNHLAQFDRQWG